MFSFLYGEDERNLYEAPGLEPVSPTQCVYVRSLERTPPDADEVWWKRSPQPWETLLANTLYLVGDKACSLAQSRMVGRDALHTFVRGELYVALFSHQRRDTVLAAAKAWGHYTTRWPFVVFQYVLLSEDDWNPFGTLREDRITRDILVQTMHDAFSQVAFAFRHVEDVWRNYLFEASKAAPTAFEELHM